MLSRIAEAQATAVDARTALATARRIANEGDREVLLANICEIQCWENNVPDALATAGEIKLSRLRCEAHLTIARHQTEAREIAGASQSIALALQAAEAIADSDECARAHVYTARTTQDAVAGLAAA